MKLSSKQLKSAAADFVNIAMVRTREVLAHPVWGQAPAQWTFLAIGLMLLTIIVTVPLDFTRQAMFSVGCLAAAIVIRKIDATSRLAIITLIVISVSVSLRYMFWRLTSTIAFETGWDAFFGWGLVCAELYSLLVLLLGYVQTAWPLRRKPIPLPADRSSWPTVDVFIATYNEPLSVVRQTVFSALSMDWPSDKLKVYILDDGRREEFRLFAEETGAHYVTRDNNRHAKAGNLNEALKVTHGEYVAMFDCDHIPTRSFLQVCMGWFLKDPNLAMLQTPHYFFSPDPFEKNLKTFRQVPNEGELFYGLIQDGNDLWNATFFCGSCAVIRRAPLLEVGGVATETVTEDAHTALKMSRRGYNTAYLAIPQAAGLATESLSGHIGQRIRWARGMGQIFRVDNPMLGPGLKMGQRFCYLNAMLHFFYGLPRLVFLTAPLAYLLFGAQIYEASALMVVVYALPHVVMANLTNSTIQGKYRHSFWNEVYETVLAWYILAPVILAVINPKLGKFNVTAKGGRIINDYYDWKMARPYIVILLLNLTGLVAGVWQVALSEGSYSTLMINLVWVFYNVIVASASADVANEARQVRLTARVAAKLPATIMLSNGKTIMCETSDFSQNGVGLKLPGNMVLPVGERVNVSIFRGQEEGVFPAKVLMSKSFGTGVEFQDLSIAQQMKLAQMTFARADTWAATWGEGKPDNPWSAMKEVTKIGLLNMVRLVTSLVRHVSAIVQVYVTNMLSKNIKIKIKTRAQ